MTGTALCGEEIDIRRAEAGEEQECDNFVRFSALGTLFHLSAWRAVVEESLNRRCFCLVARRGGNITGLLPLSTVRSRIFGDCLVSLPLAVYGGICAADEPSYFALLRAGEELARSRGVKYLEMRNRTEPFATGLPGRDLYVTFVQDLTPGADKLFQALPRDTRYAIRKGQKAGLRWTEDVTLDEFYDIYARSVHRLGTPVFSRKLFAVIQHHFAGNCRLFGVRKGETAIAAVLCFYFRDQVIPYYGGSLANHTKESANNFMYWQLIAQSCEEGYRLFDFGRSKLGTGSFAFKSSWSMRPDPLPYRYVLVRAKGVPQLSPVDQKFHLPVAAWQRLPFPWTKVLGPRVIRLLPSI